MTIALLLLAAGIAAAAAYRVPWTAVLTAPLLCVALVFFAGEGYSQAPARWLIATMLGVLVLGLLAGRLNSQRSLRRSAQ